MRPLMPAHAILVGAAIIAAAIVGVGLVHRVPGRYQAVVMREGVLLHIDTATGAVLLCAVSKPTWKTEDKLTNYGAECTPLYFRRLIAGWATDLLSDMAINECTSPAS
jgi:hypothetical protein